MGVVTRSFDQYTDSQYTKCLIRIRNVSTRTIKTQKNPYTDTQHTEDHGADDLYTECLCTDY